MRGRWSFDLISDAIRRHAETGSFFRKTTIIGLALANALAFTALTPLPAAAQGGKVKVKVSHNHWQNGGLAKNQLFPKDFSFVNGNLNFVHNHYQESDTVPLRWVMQDLKTSTNYLLTIEWDSTKKQGQGPV